MTCPKLENLAVAARQGGQSLEIRSFSSVGVVGTRRRGILQTIFAASVVLLSVVWSVSSPAQIASPVPSLYRDGEMFLTAIAHEKLIQTLRARLPASASGTICWLQI